MTRLAATVVSDVRLQYRNGFYAASVFLVVMAVLLLHALPAEVARAIVPAVILEAVLVNSFYFVSALLLLERGEGSFVAQSVTPLRDWEYLAGKLISLTALSLLEGLVIAASLLGIGLWLLPMALGIVLMAILFCLVGVMLALRYDSINAFLLPSVPLTFLLSLPIFGAFGLGAPELYLLHPAQGPFGLLQWHGSLTLGGFAYAVIYPLLWIVPAAWLSLLALRRARNP